MQKVTNLPLRGIRGGLLLFMALCMHSAARGQTQYEYWFDNDHSTAVTSTSSLVEVDVSGLSESLHAIHIQVKGTGKKVVGHTIYTWKDDDIDFVQYVVNTEDEQMLSAPITRYFVKVPQQGITVRCWVDGDLSTLQQNVATGQTVMLDLAAVSDGFHYLTVQPVGQGGGVGTPRVYPFVKVPQMASDEQMTCVYTIDGSITGSVAASLGNGTYHFDADVSSLSDGIHRISFVLCNSQGVIAKAETHFFMKIPVGGYGITQYWYWLNDDDSGAYDVMKVTLESKQDPFILNITPKLVEKPIRSKKFAFGFLDGELSKPAIFAKNDLHMRFFDVGGRFTDLVREYVDERVYQLLDIGYAPMMPVSGYNNDLSQSSDGMQWYVLALQAGNVLRLQLNRQATVQVFSAITGEELYSAEGEDATTWTNIDIPTDGNYYIVVHDPANNNNNVAVNYDIITLVGDADGNNTVNIADAIAVVNHILKKATPTFIEKAADVNNDNKITISDAVGIVNIILQGNQ